MPAFNLASPGIAACPAAVPGGPRQGTRSRRVPTLRQHTLTGQGKYRGFVFTNPSNPINALIHFSEPMKANRKDQFTQAVRLLAPGNEFILKVASLVPESDLPPIAGVAAFELAATLETLQRSWRFRQPLRPTCVEKQNPSGLLGARRRTQSQAAHVPLGGRRS